MDILIQIINLVAPILASLLLGLLKKYFTGLTNKTAVIAIIVIGGLTAAIGIGPDQAGGYFDSVINAGWISGLAALLFGLFKTRR